MKKILLIILIVVVLAAVVLGLIMYFGSQPLSRNEAIKAIDKKVESTIDKKSISQAIVYVDSPMHDIDRTFVYGQLDGEMISANQPFHIASVGKAFTATLIGVLIDDGKLSLDDSISDYLSQNMLDNLFVYDGVDYQNDVTIANLLSHTSGVADYFEDDTIGSDKLQQLVLDSPDTFWTPQDLVDFTRNYQNAVGKPNEMYHYSDTGYILLGLIIESVSEQTFDEMLHEKIFVPLQMDDSYLIFYSQPANGIRPIADIHLASVNIRDYQSLSIDWSGGGIISTADNLATFIRALNNYEIITQPTLDSLYQFDYEFMSGIHYGNGFMEYHFAEFFPTLSFLPHYRGHMGVLGTQMFYDGASDTVYISSFGSTDFSSGSVQTMIQILSILERIE